MTRYSFVMVMISLPLLEGDLQTRLLDGTVQVFDPVRRIWVLLTPEEHVRQLLLQYLMNQKAYPGSLMAIERGLSFGHTSLRFDIAVYHRDTQQPWLLAECKSPEVPISEDTLAQLLHYNSKLTGCRYWVLTNGLETYCADALEPTNITWLADLPAY